MKIKISKLISWLYPVQLEKVQGELGHQLEVNVHNGRIVLDTASVNYSYGSLQEIFDYAFTHTGLYDLPIHSALIPGFGSGSVSSLLHEKCDPEIAVTGIEADREVIRLAKKYFPEARNSHVKIVHSDAARYVPHAGDNFDLVVVDVFVNDQVPEACQSPDFFARLKSHLNLHGKIYVNKMQRDEDAVRPEQLEENIRAVFHDVQVIRLPRSGALNYVYVGTRQRKFFGW
jgi:spermidine synthase